MVKLSDLCTFPSFQVSQLSPEMERVKMATRTQCACACFDTQLPYILHQQLAR